MNKYLEAERKLLSHLSELENGGEDCKCKTGTTETIHTIHMGE
jgi:hypothetical protein